MSSWLGTMEVKKEKKKKVKKKKKNTHTAVSALSILEDIPFHLPVSSSSTRYSRALLLLWRRRRVELNDPVQLLFRLHLESFLSFFTYSFNLLYSCPRIDKLCECRLALASRQWHIQKFLVFMFKVLIMSFNIFYEFTIQIIYLRKMMKTCMSNNNKYQHNIWTKLLKQVVHNNITENLTRILFMYHV